MEIILPTFDIQWIYHYFLVKIPGRVLIFFRKKVRLFDKRHIPIGFSANYDD